MLSSFQSNSTLKKSDTAATDPAADSLVLPDAVQARLDALGINGAAQVQVQSDLDAKGQWGNRYLIATPERLVVLSAPGVASDATISDNDATVKALALNGSAVTNGASRSDASRNGSAANGAASGLSSHGATSNGVAGGAADDGITVDIDVPLRDVVATEAKNLVGAISLEARLRPLAEDAMPDGVSANGVSSNDSAPPIAHPSERVVELLRSSNALSRELTHAARKLQQLRDEGAVTEDIEEDAKWKRQTCSNCGRALPQDSTVCPFCVNRIQALKRLFSYLIPYKWIAIGNGLLSVTGIALSFIPILLVQPLTNRVFNVSRAADEPIRVTGPTEYRTLGWLVAAIVLSSALGAFVNIIRGQSVAFLGARVIHDIRTQLYEQLQRLSLSYFDKREVGAVMSRVQNDVGMLQSFLLDAAENVILSSLTIAGVIVIMLSLSPMLALAVLLPVPFVIVGTNRYWRGLMKLWRRVWHQNSTLGARLADTLNGVRVVRAFAQEEREVDRFVTKSGELRDATMRVEQKASIFYPTLGFIMGLGLPITWFVGGRQVLAGTLDFGSLLVFTALLGRLYEPIQSLTRLVNFTTRAMTAAERVFEILDTTPEIRQSAQAVKMPQVEGRVEFRDVTFGYDKHRPVLHGVNLTVEPGEMIGLVGHSGAGKSSMINLLMRFYDVDEGALLVDGTDLRDIDRDDLRSQIGVVLQEPYLFHGTVFDNIVYGKPGASPAEVMSAAKAAFAHDFIVGFPDGYDTRVGERGTRLSGGERQRISIARAILHNPRILILDEATASVDTETEQQIQQAVLNLVQGRTTFAIAHRLSTLRNANRLVVLEGGKIVEQGTHDELLAKRGVFHKLVNAQQAMNELVAIGG